MATRIKPLDLKPAPEVLDTRTPKPLGLKVGLPPEALKAATPSFRSISVKDLPIEINGAQSGIILPTQRPLINAGALSGKQPVQNYDLNEHVRRKVSAQNNDLSEVDQRKVDEWDKTNAVSIHTPRPLNLQSKPLPVSTPIPKAMTSGDRLLDAALNQVEKKFPEAWPRSGGHLRALMPLTMTKVLDLGRQQMDQVSAIVSQSTAIHRDFEDLHVPETLASILAGAQGQGAHRHGFFTNLKAALSQSKATQQVADHRVPVMALITALRSFPGRTDQLHARALDLWKDMEAVVAATSVASDVLNAIKDVDTQRFLQTLDDRRRIILQSASQIQLVPEQLKMLDQQTAELLNRADQLVTITLPALEANR